MDPSILSSNCPPPEQKTMQEIDKKIDQNYNYNTPLHQKIMDILSISTSSSKNTSDLILNNFVSLMKENPQGVIQHLLHLCSDQAPVLKRLRFVLYKTLLLLPHPLSQKSLLSEPIKRMLLKPKDKGDWWIMEDQKDESSMQNLYILRKKCQRVILELNAKELFFEAVIVCGVIADVEVQLPINYFDEDEEEEEGEGGEGGERKQQGRKCLEVVVDLRMFQGCFRQLLDIVDLPERNSDVVFIVETWNKIIEHLINYSNFSVTNLMLTLSNCTLFLDLVHKTHLSPLSQRTPFVSPISLLSLCQLLLQQTLPTPTPLCCSLMDNLPSLVLQLNEGDFGANSYAILGILGAFVTEDAGQGCWRIVFEQVISKHLTYRLNENQCQRERQENQGYEEKEDEEGKKNRMIVSLLEGILEGSQKVVKGVFQLIVKEIQCGQIQKGFYMLEICKDVLGQIGEKINEVVQILAEVNPRILINQERARVYRFLSLNSQNLFPASKEKLNNWIQLAFVQKSTPIVTQCALDFISQAFEQVCDSKKIHIILKRIPTNDFSNFWEVVKKIITNYSHDFYEGELIEIVCQINQRLKYQIEKIMNISGEQTFVIRKILQILKEIMKNQEAIRMCQKIGYNLQYMIKYYELSTKQNFQKDILDVINCFLHFATSQVINHPETQRLLKYILESKDKSTPNLIQEYITLHEFITKSTNEQILTKILHHLFSFVAALDPQNPPSQLSHTLILLCSFVSLHPHLSPTATQVLQAFEGVYGDVVIESRTLNLLLLCWLQSHSPQQTQKQKQKEMETQRIIFQMVKNGCQRGIFYGYQLEGLARGVRGVLQGGVWREGGVHKWVQAFVKAVQFGMVMERKIKEAQNGSNKKLTPQTKKILQNMASDQKIMSLIAPSGPCSPQNFLSTFEPLLDKIPLCPQLESQIQQLKKGVSLKERVVYRVKAVRHVQGQF